MRRSDDGPARPNQLDEYERLVWEQRPTLTHAEVLKIAFDWQREGVTLGEFRDWLAVGASLHDIRLVRAFRRAGISPEVAGQPVVRGGNVLMPTRVGDDSWLTLVRQRRLSAAEVRAIAERAGRLPKTS